MRTRRCECLTCEMVHLGALDYRNDKQNKFVPHACPLCEILETEPRFKGFIAQPTFTPDAVSDFLGMKYVCVRCLARMDFRLKRQMRGCWAKADPAVIQLVIVMMIRSELVNEVATEFRHKLWITQSLVKHDAVPEWATEAQIEAAKARIVRRMDGAKTALVSG